MDKSKLIKFLELSASLNDGEALSSIRKANNFIKENDTNWEEIIRISDSLEAYIRKQNDDNAVNQMIMKKESAYSFELEEKIKGYKNLIIYLILIIIVLLIVIII